MIVYEYRKGSKVEYYVRDRGEIYQAGVVGQLYIPILIKLQKVSSLPTGAVERGPCLASYTIDNLLQRAQEWRIAYGLEKSKDSKAQNVLRSETGKRNIPRQNDDSFID